MPKLFRCLVLSSAVFLAGCGSRDDSEETKIDYAAFDDAALSKMFEERQYGKILKIIREQRDLDIADKNDYLLAARIHILQNDPISATVAIERAKSKKAKTAEVALLEAKAFVQQGEFTQAVEALEGVDLAQADVFEAELLRGDIYKQLGQPEMAREFFAAAVKANENDFRGYLGLALLDLIYADLEAAETNIQKADKLNPEDPIVLYVRGALSRFRGDVETAKQLLLKAVELRAGHVMAHLELASIYIEEGALQDAETELDAVYATAPDHSLALYYSALLLAEKGKNDEAEELLLKMGDVARNYPPAVRVYGHVAYKLEKYTTARPYLEQFLALVPSDRPTRLALAESLNRRGESRLALNYLEPLLGPDSQDVEAMLQAASAHGMLGEINKTRDILEKIESLRGVAGISEEKLQRLGLRLAFANFLTGDVVAAVGLLEKMANDSGNDFASLLLLANLQMKSGALDAANSTARKILEIAPSSPVGHNIFATVLYKQRSFESALGAVEKALAVNADYASALKNKGLILIALGRSEQAAIALAKLHEMTPDDVQVQAMLGRAFLMQENNEQAMIHLRAAAEALPNSPIIKLDYSEALAANDLLPAAVIKAKEARELAAGDNRLIAHIDGVIDGWEAIRAEKRAEHEAEADERRKQLEEQKKLREAEQARILSEKRKVRLLRNQLFGNWVATSLLELEGEAVTDYIKAINEVDNGATDIDILRKVQTDLEAMGIVRTNYEIEKSMRDYQLDSQRKLIEQEKAVTEEEAP